MSEHKYGRRDSDTLAEQSVLAEKSESAIFDVNIFTVDFSKGLRKFWYIVVIIAVLFGFSSAYLRHSNYVPMYRSSVSFSVSAVSYNSSGNAVFASYYDNSSAAQLSKTFPYIVNTNMMRNALKEELNTNYINGSITAEAVASDSNIFKVSVSSNSPEDALNIVNAIIKVYPEVALFVVGNVNLNILIKPTLPDTPYTVDNFIRTGIIMALVGACLGFCIIGVYAFFRNTLRKKDDFKNILNQKCFVEIPFVIFHRKTNDKKAKDRMVLITDRHPTFKESFRLLRKRLLRNLKNHEKIIAVTAPVAGEGKTTVAYNIAHTLAIDGKKTAVVDFDFRVRSLQKYLEAENEKGFCDVVAENSDDFGKVARIQEDNFYVFTAGTSNIEFSESKFESFFKYLRANFDYVFVILAPGGEISNSVSVSNMCDCILLVAKQDSSSVEKNRKCLEYLSFSQSRILGYVFNGIQDGFSGYGGYYYGGKYGYGKYGYGRSYGKYGYGKYGYGKYGYGYGKHGYGYGYGKGYGYGYGYGEEPDKEAQMNDNRHHSHHPQNPINIHDVDDFEIPDNNI